jgi:lipopolysaccharide transport system ATP-binding protein
VTISDPTVARPVASAPAPLELADSPVHARDLLVEMHDVGKMYKLYAHPQDRLKDSLFWRFGRRYGHEFWALRDVSFELRRGETLGIIGRNGSGKSTLLQVVAGVLQPTTGSFATYGRLAALLELGSGFNPEFTGRENVFLSGAILGLQKHEIEARFDEVASFADIGDFLDQPVKLYSSGMYVRLAFALSTSVDADILVIDEALAVGDIFFRQKCYQRLQALRDRGVAVILVSHAMLDVEQFCQRAILLEHGRPTFQGPSDEAVKRYYLIDQQHTMRLASTSAEPAGLDGSELTSPTGAETAVFWPAADAFLDLSAVPEIGTGEVRCTAVTVCNLDGQPTTLFEQGETAVFYYEFECLRDVDVPIGGVVIMNDKNVTEHGKNTLQYDSVVPRHVPAGTRLRFVQRISLDLAVGEHSFEVGLATLSPTDYARRADFAHDDLNARIVRLTHLPRAGYFTITFRRTGHTVQLLHHGIADLPGDCALTVVHPDPGHGSGDGDSRHGADDA